MIRLATESRSTLLVPEDWLETKDYKTLGIVVSRDQERSFEVEVGAILSRGRWVEGDLAQIENLFPTTYRA